MMKPYLTALAALAVVAVAFSACTTTSTTTTAQTKPQYDQTVKRVHTAEELQKTGRPEVGDALQAVDPAVTYNPGH